MPVQPSEQFMCLSAGGFFLEPLCVLLVTGPRQVGKTTMLEHLAQKEGRGRETVTLDDLTIIRISYLGRGMGLKKELADGVSLSALSIILRGIIAKLLRRPKPGPV